MKFTIVYACWKKEEQKIYLKLLLESIRSRIFSTHVMAPGTVSHLLLKRPSADTDTELHVSQTQDTGLGETRTHEHSQFHSSIRQVHYCVHKNLTLSSGR
jgi:hypothetical protein